MTDAERMDKLLKAAGDAKFDREQAKAQKAAEAEANAEVVEAVTNLYTDDARKAAKRKLKEAIARRSFLKGLAWHEALNLFDDDEQAYRQAIYDCNKVILDHHTI